SYDLLDESEKALFRRLCVFVGGCTLEAAEAICDATADVAPGTHAVGVGHPAMGIEILDGVASLVEKSLLLQKDAVGNEPRLSMLETIREYGAERLREAGEAIAVRDRHLDFFLHLAEAAEPRLHGGEQLAW